MAQLGEPDMMHAITSYPDRIDLSLNFPDFAAMDGLTFDAPDAAKRFPSLEFAYEACRRGGTLPAVMNATTKLPWKLFLKNVSALSIFYPGEQGYGNPYLH